MPKKTGKKAKKPTFTPESLEAELSQRPEFQGDLFRSYGPGKFNNYAEMYVFELSLDRGDDDEIEEGGNVYTLMNGPFEHPQLSGYAGAILMNNDQGFVTVDFIEGKRNLESEWKRIVSEIEAESESDDPDADPDYG